MNYEAVGVVRGSDDGGDYRADVVGGVVTRPVQCLTRIGLWVLYCVIAQYFILDTISKRELIEVEDLPAWWLGWICFIWAGGYLIRCDMKNRRS